MQKKTAAPVSYRAGRFKELLGNPRGLRLTFAAELGQAQIPYDSTKQDHGARFRRVEQKLLHRLAIGIITYRYDDIPAGAVYPCATAACACGK